MNARSKVLVLEDISACAPNATGRPIDRTSAETMSVLLKAVADPARLQLLSMLKQAVSQEACVCDLTAPLGLSQPTVSHHLKVLTDAGLVTRERRGSWAWFTLVPAQLEKLKGFFE
jgi:ArsR family transcriptional regulator